MRHYFGHDEEPMLIRRLSTMHKNLGIGSETMDRVMGASLAVTDKKRKRELKMGIMLQSDTQNGGDDICSNTDHNSYPQRTAIDVVKAAIDETISEQLDITFSSTSSNTFCVADMGCSVGPNTFYCVKNIIETVKKKLMSQGLASDQMPEFQVFFNDLAYNDFNTLFMSLPPQKQYFSAGVPGSFYGRLFPKSSLHFVHSSYALQWLSQVPEEVLDMESPTWNRGRVHHSNAPKVVVDAFAAQFAKDMGMFLDARAKELMEGGMMVLIIPSIPDGILYSSAPAGILFNHLGSCLVDMAKEGLISEALVDSFNIPLYAATPKEMTELIEQNGCFGIERMVSTGCINDPDDRPTGHSIVMHLRAGMEGIISKHFGHEIIDELFDRILERIDELVHLLASSNSQGTQLTVILKRRYYQI